MDLTLKDPGFDKDEIIESLEQELEKDTPIWRNPLDKIFRLAAIAAQRFGPLHISKHRGGRAERANRVNRERKKRKRMRRMARRQRKINRR